MPRGDRDWTRFLERASGGIFGVIDSRALGRKLEGKVVAITGAGGFIGSALARMLPRFSPEHLVLLDIAEHGLHDLETDFNEDYSGSISRDLVVGDVCDAALLQDLFSQRPPDIIFHAAATKHVSLMENNPFAAAQTNILGTRTVLDAANRAGAQQFVLISTDKAVEPRGIMGASKRVAELIVLANTGPAQAKAVRLGNVLGSTGSVVPLFEWQLARGGPLTITDPDCARYFLSIEEVVEDLLSALLLDETAAVVIARTGAPRRVVDLAGFLVQSAGLDPKSIATAYSGLRPGEKLTEAMIGPAEIARDSSIGQLQYVTTSTPLPKERFKLSMDRLAAAVSSRDVHALLLAITHILPAYQPSPALLAYAAAATRKISA